MAKFNIYEKEILKIMDKAPIPLNTSQIAENSDLSWNTVNKYLDKLDSDEIVLKKYKGNETIWALNTC